MPFDVPAAITATSGLIAGVINRIWPDPTEEEKSRLEQAKTEIGASLSVLNSQVSVIVAEAQGGGWLQRNWRPITMLVFLALVVGHFFGMEGPNFTAEDSAHLFSLVELGLGGYVIGRTVEKVAPIVIRSVRDR